MIACDIKIKELKKQGYISGVMAGKEIRACMERKLTDGKFNEGKLYGKIYQYLIDHAKEYVTANGVDVCGTIRWYYDKNDLINWVENMLSNRRWLESKFSNNVRYCKYCGQAICDEE